MNRMVFFISDQTGLTVQRLGEALLAHFPDTGIDRVDIPFIDTEAKAGAGATAPAKPAEKPAAPASSGTMPRASSVVRFISLPP